MIYKEIKPQVPGDLILLMFAIAVSPLNLKNTHVPVRKGSQLSSESRFESGPLSL